MSLNREAIEAALLAFFSDLESVEQDGGVVFRTTTRNVRTWSEVAAEDQPALLLLKKRENSEKRLGLPTKWTLGFDLLVYVATNSETDPQSLPTQRLNPILDAIEAALAPDDVTNDACTLGGLVTRCSIDGDIEIHPGHLGDEAVAVIPFSILTTA